MIYRLIPALLLSFGVSFGLFWLMHMMLQRHDTRGEQSPLTEVDYVRLQYVEKPPEIKERAAPPPLADNSAAPPAVEVAEALAFSPAQPSAPSFDLPKLDIPIAGGGIATQIAAGGPTLTMPMPRAEPGQRQLSSLSFGADSGAAAPIVRIPPVYPLDARRQKIEGWVRVEMTIMEDGSVANVKVRKAQPGGIFEQAAIAAVSQWKFRPAVENGKAVRRRAGQTLKFELQD